MLGIPPPTPFDLKFRLLGIPVRVSPWFWLATILLGLPREGQVNLLFIWLGCVFFSILIHEFGHGLTSKAFGYSPQVILYSFGGLCVSEGERKPNERLAVLLMGPGAGFLLLFVVFGFGWLVLGIGPLGDWILVRELFGFSYKPDPGKFSQTLINFEIAWHKMSFEARFAYQNLIWVNLVWGLVNLLPIFPLDGGQVAQVLLTKADRVHGARRTHIISMVTAGILAAYVASRMGGPNDGGNSLFLVIFFGMFALMNYQALQAHHQHYVDNGPDDADWWKR